MLNQLTDKNPSGTISDMKCHHSVMPKEVMRFLNPKPGDTIIDGTLGLGGHSEEILRAIGLKGRLIGIDRDAKSLEIAANNLKRYSKQCDLVNENFKNIDQVMSDLNILQVDGILLDLGISSYQMNESERGFSFQEEGPLDMRMDQSNQLSAFDLINSLTEKEISAILKEYGEERWHNRIARVVIEERTRKPIETTQDLSQVVLRAIPSRKNRAWSKIHPATRTFQAFRIAVNRELEAVDMAIDRCVDALKVGGRLVIISFHSLEDRIVKHRFRTLSKIHRISLIVKKPLRPTVEETQINPRARSARMRIAERI